MITSPISPLETIELLFAEKPKFHNAFGEMASWNSQREILQYIARRLGPETASLETGCGYSTVISAATGSRHTCVTPSREESDGVLEFCTRHGIPTEKLSFAIGISQDALPSLAEDGELDYVYIDGAHRFPIPCIDWAFTEQRLKTGGVVLVDDVRIPSCRVLHDFLQQEKNWRLSEYIGDTSIFEKTAPSDFSRDWVVQSFNSSYPDFSFFPIKQRIPAECKRVANGLARRARRLFGKN